MPIPVLIFLGILAAVVAVSIFATLFGEVDDLPDFEE